MRIVIAEDAAVIRAGLAEILTDRGHEIVAAVGDAEALKDAVAARQPDVAIVDVRMPPSHTDEGLRAAIAIRRDHPGVGILVRPGTPPTCSPLARAGSVTCSRTGSPTSPSSPTRSRGSPAAAPR
jgi:CheY-like chemotaxis protein